MSSSTESSKDQDPFEKSPLSPNRLGAAFGFMDVIVFTVVGFVIFDDLLAGGLAGLSIGTGVFLFLPLFVTGSETDGGLADMESNADRHPFRSFHRLAAGMALAAGGLAYFSYFFVEESLVAALPIGLLVAVIGYVVLAFVVPNAEL